LISCELTLVYGYLLPSRFKEERNPYLAPMRQFGDIYDFLRTRPQPLRVHIDDENVKFNFGDFYGVEQYVGYLASLTTNTRALDWGTTRAKQLLAVNYDIAKAPTAPDQELLFTGSSGFKVYRNPSALDRARLIHAPDADSGELPPLERCDGPEDVTFLKHGAGHEVLLANTNCRAMLVIAETYYPGWRANVDGKPVRIYEPYGMLRGIVLQQGSHRVELTYRPASVLWGAACSIAGLIIAIALTFVDRRRATP
jgi:hypothetical protein